MAKFFVTSDVHGFFDIFQQELLNKGFEIDNPEHKLVVCGDLFDRGDQVIELFDFVKGLGDRFIYVRGNHEDLLFDCYNELLSNRTPGYHHVSNGTISTICQFTGLTFYNVFTPCPERTRTFGNKMEPVLRWIENKSVNYFETAKYVFVHGWVPCYQGLDDFREATNEDWDRARWNNGMEMWKNPRCRVEGKTVVCGHWHCSWGWSHIKQDRKEFPQKNRNDWKRSFEPFADDGIMAIDACTAYTELCNMVVIEDEFLEGDANGNN